MRTKIGVFPAGILVLVLLVGAFGLYRSVVQAQAANLEVTPVKAAKADSENTSICAKCGGDFAKFTIKVTDAAANTSATTTDTVTVSVKNLDLGTLGVPTNPDSNPKTITLLEDGANTGVFIRVVTAVNKTFGLVSDVIPGTADATPTTTILTDASLTAAVLRDADEGAIVGGTLKYTSGAAAGEAQTVTGFSVIDGTVTTAAFTGVPTTGDAYELFPIVNIIAFSGQTLEVTYTPAGESDVSTTIKNDEVKPTLLISSPAENLIIPSSSFITVVFSADITDTAAGFPAAITDLVINNNTSGNKGTIKLTLGTVTVPLKKENFTAVTDGYRLTASFTSDALLSLAPKLPWWIEAQDLAGNTQEPSQKISGTTSANGAGDGTTIVDSFLANGAGVCGTCFVGRQVTINIGGINQTRIIDAYDPATGAFTFTADGSGQSTDSFSTQILSGTSFTIDKTLLVTVTIDVTAPVVNTVVTGEAWNAASSAGSRLRTGLSAKRNSIRITVTDTSGLDPATVVTGAFAVSGGHTISSVLVVDVVGENTDPPVQQVPNDIFITLGEDLSPSNERPTVTITGGVIMDKAGNSLAESAPKAVDKLGPNLIVTLNKTLSNSNVTATIIADELLLTSPTGEVKALTSAETGALGAVPGADPGTGTTQTGTLTFTKTISTAAIGAGVAGVEFNIYVEGSDTGSNKGKAGHKTDGTNASAITFELDQWLNNGGAPQVLVVDKEAKATNVSGNQTTVPKVDAVDPLIVTLDFNRSCDLSAGPTPPANQQDCSNNGESAEYTGDSHKTVTLTSASVKVTFSDGTTETTAFDVATQVSSPDSKRFTMPILAPKVGKYKLTIKAQDEAGNIALKNPTAVSAQSLTYEWEVTKAKPVTELPVAIPGVTTLSLVALAVIFAALIVWHLRLRHRSQELDQV